MQRWEVVICRGLACPEEGFLDHVVCHVEDACHHLISRQHIVGVEGVNDTLFCLTERAGAGYATQHEDTEVVGVGGRGIIHHLTCLVVVIERLSHEVDIVDKGQAMALPEHEVVQQGERASEGPAV
jgi:hypothetical protein